MDTLSVHGDGTPENDEFQPKIFQSHLRCICGAPDFIFGEKKCMRFFSRRMQNVPKFQEN